MGTPLDLRKALFRVVSSLWVGPFVDLADSPTTVYQPLAAFVSDTVESFEGYAQRLALRRFLFFE